MYPSPVRVYRQCDSVDPVFSHLTDKQDLYEAVCMDFTDAETEDMDPSAELPDQFKSNSTNHCSVLQQERAWREMAYDYEIRFCGHCNTTTDIKEANFFGR